MTNQKVIFGFLALSTSMAVHTAGAALRVSHPDSIRTAIEVPSYAPPVLREAVLQSPFGGVAHTIPGIIEMEDFDNGGEGVAYHDEEEENKGDEYRTDEGVDLDKNGDGYVLGWTIKDEWLEYTIDVQTADSYKLIATVASGLDGSGFKLYLDDKEITGTITVPNTGSWTDFSSVNATTSVLSVGEHVLKVEIVSSYCNIDKIVFKAEHTPIDYTFTSPATESEILAGQDYTVSWEASDEADGKFKLNWVNENGDVTILKEDAGYTGQHTATIPSFFAGQSGHYELTQTIGELIPSKLDGQSHTVSNPIIWSDVPDVAVCRVDDTYYMASTTMHMNPGVPIMASKDLVRWRTINYAHQALANNDNLNLENGKTAYGKGSWASSIRYKNGTYYVLTPSYTTGKTHIFKTKDILNGPWETATLPFYHDPSLFIDDDDRVYVLYGSGNTNIVELSADAMSVKAGATARTLLSKPASVAGSSFIVECEGTQIMKKDGYYYIFMISWPSGSCRSVLCYRGKSLDGTFEGKVLLKDNGVAQGGIFDTPDGDWYGMFFRDGGSVGRIPYLLPVTWSDNWPVLGNSGKVPSTLNMKAAQEKGFGMVTSDEFSEIALPLEWQWNHNPDASHWKLSNGVLRLSNGRTDADLVSTKNTLTQRSYGPTCSAYTKLNTAGMQDGDYAGICALQELYGFSGVKKSGSSKYIVMMDASSGTATEAATVPLNQDSVWLRIDMNFLNQTDQATFYYSLDGNSWSKFGNTLKMQYKLTHFMGYRYGLFSFGTKSSAGYADFDFFRIGDNVDSPIYLDKEGTETVVATSAKVSIVKELTGVDEMQVYSVRAYPNPAHEYIEVAGVTENVELRLYNSTGVLMGAANGNRMEVGALPRGIYVLHIVSADGSLVQKVVLQ